MSKETFKQFVQNHPELADYVFENNITWQKLYETYDMYGENSDIWNKYVPKKTKTINDIFTKLDTNAIQEHIKNAQKALAVIGELTSKTSENIEKNIKPSIEKPINKFFGE
jgi:hypothetical protein